MTIQEAIEKAIEGGWKHPFTGLPAFRAPTEEWLKENWRKYAHIFLDPLFWQSLGKAMGWGWRCSYCNGHFDKEKGHNDGGKLYPEANKKWHRFIDHLAEGKDAESFFETL